MNGLENLGVKTAGHNHGHNLHIFVFFNNRLAHFWNKYRNCVAGNSEVVLQGWILVTRC